MKNSVRSLILAVGLVGLATGNAQVVGGDAAAIIRSGPPAAPDFERTIEEQLDATGVARVIFRLKPGKGSMAASGNRNARGRATGLERRRAVAEIQERVLRDLDLRRKSRLKRFRHIPFVAAEVDGIELDRLRHHADVASIELDSVFRPTLDRSVPLIGADLAWADGYTGAGQAIAIVDTGVESNHSALTGKVIAQACFSSQTSDYSLCPDGVDQFIGGDSGEPCDRISVGGGCFHGTHVAGIAAGAGSDIQGVARDGRIIAIQVFSNVTDSVPGVCSSPPCLVAFTSDTVLALEHVLSLAGQLDPIQVSSVNLSLGGGLWSSALQCDADNASMKAAIDNLRAAGIATVIASGNDSQFVAMSAPACISSAISVGSTTVPADPFDAEVSGFSNGASWLSLLAPGNNIYSSVPGDGFRGSSGTSMAAPHVAGIWALSKQKQPGASVDEILAALSTTGVPIDDTPGGFTRPLVQADLGIGVLPAGSPPPGDPFPEDLIVDAEQLDIASSTVSGSFACTDPLGGATDCPAGVFDTRAYGGFALVGLDEEGNAFRFDASLQDGYYRVHGWWPSRPGNPDQLAVTVTGADGDSFLEIDQRTGAGSWQELGVFGFEQGMAGSVELATIGPGVVADAVRFEFLGASFSAIELASASYQADESQGSVDVTLTRIGAAVGDASVRLAIRDGTATVGSDYTGVDRIVSFVDGERSRTVSIPLADDAIGEFDETVLIDLSAPSGAMLDDVTSAVITIIDDDVLPVISGLVTDADTGSAVENVEFTATGNATCTPSDAAGAYACPVAEGWSGTVTPSRSGADFTPSSRDYVEVGADLPGEDYAATIQTEVVWVEDALPAGASKIGAWSWVGDSPPPYSGTLAHRSALKAGLHQHVFFGATEVLSVQPGDALFAYVYLDPDDPPREIMLQWQAPDSGNWGHRAYWGENLITWGADGTAARHHVGPLPAPGQWARLEVPAAALGLEGAVVSGMGFILYDGRATFDHAGRGAPGEASSVLSFGAGAFSADENGGQAVVTVRRTGSGAGAVGVSYATADDTAQAGVDYTGVTGAVQFADGDTTDKTFTVPLVDDEEFEADETILLTLSTPTGGAELGPVAAATLTVVDDEVPPVRRLNGVVTDVDSGAAVSGVTFAAAGDGDGTCAPSDTAGAYACSVPDGWSGTVTPSRSGLMFTPPSRDYVDVGANLPGEDYVATSQPEVVWVEDALPAGASKIGPWNWVGDSPLPYSGTLAHRSALKAGLHQHVFYRATETLSVQPGDALFAYVYLDPDDPPREIMLQWQAPDSGNWGHRAYWGENLITWGADGTAARHHVGPLPAPGQWARLEVPAAALGLEGAVVSGMGFVLYDGRATFDHAGRGAPGEASSVLSFGAGAFSADENGGQAVVTVRRTGSGAGAVGVSYATADDTAQAGVDYTGVTGAVQFADGDTTDKTFTVPLVDDEEFEADETILLTLSTPTGGAELGPVAAATLTVVDDEVPPVRRLNGVVTDVDSGAAVSGVTFAAAGDGDGTCAPSDTAGAYACSVPDGWSGTVTPSRSGLVFTPPSRDYVDIGADLPGEDYVATSQPEVVWVEDALPAGASKIGPWNWVGDSPLPYSGTLAHRSALKAGLHQHVFYRATETLSVQPGDALFAYVYLDPDDPPREIMLQWQAPDSGNWGHRAYWGENLITWGADGTAARHHVGPLPAPGQWARLEVPAAALGLEGAVVSGMGFILYDGRATFDHVGRGTPTP